MFFLVDFPASQGATTEKNIGSQNTSKGGHNPHRGQTLPLPLLPKNEIEKQVRDLLHSGFIQPTSSTHSSLVVLVKKMDGTWRMCVDYHVLNKVTIKYKFPVPNIDELLNELHGSCYFSKLDLL